MRRIALIAEYDPAFAPHVATERALQHAARALGVAVAGEWLSTAHLDAEALRNYSGVWVAPGSPYKSLANTLAAIHFARENDIPLLGTCGGFQHVVLEIARNLLGLKDAAHAEYDPYASTLFISQLACSLAGRELPIALTPGTRAADLYGELEAVEAYYCNFGLHADALTALKRAPIVFSGADAEGEARIVELPDHRFFLATLFVPQTRSTPAQPHPLVMGFVRSCIG
ncbi:CTP synthase C-terminal region-related (seleno)protein [Magnetofaba australis]|uniref:CTP synthase (glutamine hydrolyzing) n=1 Tax=Magnetofaba australis IT-1 TaxID=1434232 RepID=A0A1Y2K3T2_9PROT|nr:CTP synthase [Magnetofaba australis]OSM04055.1 putative CTP synthase [Magnetofaba australis IT-1]